MSSANWPTCIAFTLAQEGGLVDDPADPGGLTNFGISQRAYPNVDIRGLTAAAASDIYRRDYWNAVSGDSLPIGLDLMVFDMAVNAGVGRSAMILQGCIGVTADGAIGPMTLLAAAGADPAMTVASLGSAQLDYYESLDGWSTFGEGWGARVQRRQVAAVASITGASL